MDGIRSRKGELYSSLLIPIALLFFLTLFAVGPENITDGLNGSHFSESAPADYFPGDNQTLPDDEIVNISIPEENVTGEAMISLTNDSFGDLIIAENTTENATQDANSSIGLPPGPGKKFGGLKPRDRELEYETETDGSVVRMRVRNHTITQIELLNWSENATIDVDSFALPGYAQAYALNPHGINSARVTAVAAGTLLYKCKEWDYANRECLAEWAFLMHITPGEPYTFMLGPDDPALAELANGTFFDGFESNSFATNNWTVTGGGARPWIISSVNPYQGTYHAEAHHPAPPSYLTVNISTVGFGSVTFSYYRRLVGLDPSDNFNASWYNGSAWIVVEETLGTSVDDAAYFNRNFSLPISASNNPNFKIQFGCAASTGGEYCRLDNVQVNGTNSPPNATLNSPANGYVFNTTAQTVNVTFNCSATDDIGLKNISLYITNSTNQSFSLNRTTNISGTGNGTTWALNLSAGNYTWNCLAFDGTSLSDWGDANRSFTINSTVDYAPNSILISPPNGILTPNTSINFTCNATDDRMLSNMTFYWNYSGAWQANGTVSVGGTANQTGFFEN